MNRTPMAEAIFTDNGNGRWLLSGELDFTTVSAVLVHRGAGMRPGRDIRVDLAGVTRVDSAGLVLMIDWLRESDRAGLSIVYENVPEQLQTIARVCGLDGILPLSSGTQ